ncbi:hypothetical protein [Acidovorax sp.]|uniref:hypothetical protein n=1 Tax=Acidovorax sp. TaxID=1872122 RepID=UPI0039E33D7C
MAFSCDQLAALRTASALAVLVLVALLLESPLSPLPPQAVGGTSVAVAARVAGVFCMGLPCERPK